MELDPDRFYKANLHSIKIQREMGISRDEMVNVQIPPWLIFLSCEGANIPLNMITPELLDSVMRQGGTDHPDPTLRSVE